MMRKDAIRVVLIAALSLAVCRHHEAAAMPEPATKGKCAKKELQAYIDLVDRILSEKRVNARIANQKLKDEKPNCVVDIAEMKEIAGRSHFFHSAEEGKSITTFVFWRGWLWNYFEVGFGIRHDSMMISLPYGRPAVWTL